MRLMAASVGTTSLNECGPATVQPIRGPPTHAMTAWVAKASEHIGFDGLLAPRVCEIGLTSNLVARAFLCQFPHAQYVGLRFLPAASVTYQPMESARQARMQILPGDGSRSVVRTPALAGCNVLIVNMGELEARQRRSLLVDLPNAMRRTAPNSSMFVLHGFDCPPGRVSNASTECRAKFPRNCASREDWCESWKQLVEGGTIFGSSCAFDASADWRWCVGSVNSSSSCAMRPPLLKASARTVVRLGRGDAPRGTGKMEDSRRKGLAQAVRHGLRYYSTFPCPSSSERSGTSSTEPAICMTFKDSVQETLVAAMLSTDGGLSFSGSATGSADLVLPALWMASNGARAKMAHNLAILPLANGSFLAVGGQHKHKSQPNNLGVWITRGETWRFSSKRVVAAFFGLDKKVNQARGEVAQWHPPRKIFDGNHLACVERRDPIKMPWILPGICEYDGRISFLWFKGEYLLYVRANPAAHGQRYTQLTRSKDTHTWSPFELIQIREYRYSQGDLYFFAAQVNPVQPDSLIAVFPLVHLLRACIGMAFSLDGLHWSSVTPLISCEAYGDRAVSHPVAGLVRSGEHVLLFVHEEVPSVRLDLFTPYPLERHWKANSPPARITRYAIPVARLRRWTAQHLAELRRDSKNGTAWRAAKRFNRTRGGGPQRSNALRTENERLRGENVRLTAEVARLRASG